MVEKIIEVKVSTLKNGDILATDVFNPNGKILVAKDTVLGPSTIEGLKKYFVYSVRIYKEVELDQETIDLDLRTIIIKEATEIIETQIMKQIREDKDAQYIKEMILEIMASTRVSDLLIQMRCVGGNLFRHSLSVAFYSVALGKELYYPDTRIAILTTAALLHDVGMLGIPKAVYNKEGDYDKRKSPHKKTSKHRF